jgi:hypothetical protein
MVWRSSFQSAWSEMTSGSSTPDCLAPLLDAHPAAGDGEDGIGQAARPAVLDGAGRGDDDLAGELRLGDIERMTEVAEGNAALDVEVTQADHGAVEVDGRVVAGLAEE